MAEFFTSLIRSRYRGSWDSGYNYQERDVCTSGGSIYYCDTPNVNQEPPNASYWTLMISKGADGGTGNLAALGGVAHSLATAANDFLVASGAGVFVKKTLAEVKTILGLGSAAYTASTDYAAALGADDNYATDAEKTKLANLSGTNTGDQTLYNQTIEDEGSGVTQRGTVNFTGVGVSVSDVGGKTTVNIPGGAGEAFPVGSVFLSVVSTNPGTLLGYGTWSAIAAGKMLVGLDSGDTDFDTAEETGGTKTKTIAQANLPDISTGAGTAHTHTQNAHSHVIGQVRDATTGGSTTNIAKTADTSSTIGTATSTDSATATNQNESAHTHSLGGSGTALNVMNPYFVVYIFKRTA